MSKYQITSRLLPNLGAVLLLAVTLLSGAAIAQVVSPAPMPIRVVPRMVVPEARLPVRLQKVDVRAEVLGAVAHTRVEMVFYNPNERQLEGELQFPLLDGQTVSGFALDINGELRRAVPVDKAKGQQVFEDVTRARVDPALLEKTQGNNYKLRVYPLPAHGSRRVVLEFDEMLSRNRSGNTNKYIEYTTYRLPLQFAETIEQLNVTVNNPASPAPRSALAVLARLGAEQINVSYAYDQKPSSSLGSTVSFSRQNYAGKGILSIDFPRTVTTAIATETRDDQTYFYAEVSLPAAKPMTRAAPKKLGLVWDASGSGATRNHGREFALLDAYFKALGSVNVELVIARDRAESTKSFAIQNGDWLALRTVLEKTAYDGATSLAALSPPKAADLTLLFSDGLSNYGSGGLVAGTAPLYTVHAAASSDLPRLRFVAENTGGRLLNLLNTSPADAVFELTHQYSRLVGMHSNGAKELVSESVYPDNNRLKIAGVLTEPHATIDLDWLNTQGQHQIQQITVRKMQQITDLNMTKSKPKPAASLAANRWAALQLAQLETDYTANRIAIRRLGTRFGMVTRDTSLIVLDAVDDYVRYEIMPPVSLRSEYELKLAKKTQQTATERQNHLESVLSRFTQKVSWWETVFPKGDKPEPVRSKDEAEARQGMIRAQSARASVSERPSPVPMMAMASPSSPVVHTSDVREASAKHANKAPLEASIQLKKWEPDNPYAKRLRDTASEQMYRVYLDERPANSNSTAFFLDVADIFIERGQPELGLRILSNLAEMNLENRHVLRLLAYRLLQAKQTQLALPILQQVLVLSPNEPQSYRDLGLAYTDDAQYQKAVDNLWEVVTKPWDGRFPDIDLIALAELNAIIARAPQGTSIDTSRMDARLLRNLPLDARAVLSWDADNTDIDLWVTDPNNEKVYYANRLGYQGGSMSRDFTGGYGPEEFSLRNAKPGKYKVQAQFYGNRQQVVSGTTTLMLHLSTAFGTAQQKDESIILRLTGQGSEVEVGAFEVGKRLSD